MKKGMRGITALLACLILLAVFPIGAMAAGKIDPEQDVSLDIFYAEDGTPLPKATFSLYKVASVDEYADITLTPEFEVYEDRVQDLSNLEKLDQERWSKLASTLSTYVQHDKLSPVASGKTDVAGNLPLVVKPGLYLVLGSRITRGGFTYRAIPSMLFLPAIDSENNEWSYKVTIEPKHKKTPVKPVVSRTVIKVWKDEGYESIRPDKVTVDLLCDGTVYDTVELNAGNNWRHTWKDLDNKKEWTFSEREVKDYTTTIVQNGSTFTITNTYGAKDIIVDPPVYKRIVGDVPENAETFTFVLTGKNANCPMPAGSVGLIKEVTITGAGHKEFGEIKFTKPGTYTYTISEKNTGSAGYTYDETVYSIEFKVTESNGELKVERKITNGKGKEVDRVEFTNRFGNKIPQTGMLWWPVPVLLFVGLVLLVIGIKLRKRSDQ